MAQILVADDERIDTMSDKYPRVFTFIYSDKCGCSCRSLMRSIVRRPVAVDAVECWNFQTKIRKDELQ